MARAFYLFSSRSKIFVKYFSFFLVVHMRSTHELRILLVPVQQGKMSVLQVQHEFYSIPASSSAKSQLEITHIYIFW